MRSNYPAVLFSLPFTGYRKAASDRNATGQRFRSGDLLWSRGAGGGKYGERALPGAARKEAAG